MMLMEPAPEGIKYCRDCGHQMIQTLRPVGIAEFWRCNNCEITWMLIDEEGRATN